MIVINTQIRTAGDRIKKRMLDAAGVEYRNMNEPVGISK